MIIQALAEYARRKDLVADPAFEPARVRWRLTLRADGTPVWPPLSFGEGREGRELSIPKVGARNDGKTPRFLCDTLEWAFGWSEKEEGADKRAAKLALFRHAALELAKEIDDPGALAFGAFYAAWERHGPDVAAQLAAARAKGGDIVAFRLEDDEVLLHDRPALQTLWRARYAARQGQRLGGDKGRPLYCLCCGELRPVVSTHDPIKGVIDANPVGARLLSYDKGAFASYGFKSAENGPTCAECADGYVRALNNLLKPGRTHYRMTEAGVDFCFWTREDEDDFDVTECVIRAEPVMVKKLLEPLRRGAGPQDPPGLHTPTDHFYALALSGNGGRVVVRDFLDTTVEQMKRRVGEWFQDLQVGDEPFYPGLGRLVAALLVQRRQDTLESALGAGLLRAALTGEPLPLTVVSRVVGRLRAEGDEGFSPVRLGLLRAALNRSIRKDPQKGESEMSTVLDRERDDAAYQCGRLLAVLRQIQRAYHREQGPGDVNATIIDRTYGQASATPALAMPRLMRLAQSHLGKLRKQDGEAWLEAQLTEVASRLKDFPATLTLVEQGRFALGYYHQRAEFMRSKKRADDQTPSEAQEQP